MFDPSPTISLFFMITLRCCVSSLLFFILKKEKLEYLKVKLFNWESFRSDLDNKEV